MRSNTTTKTCIHSQTQLQHERFYAEMHQYGVSMTAADEAAVVAELKALPEDTQAGTDHHRSESRVGWGR